MEGRIRLDPWTMVGGISLLVVLASLHLKITSHPIEVSRERRPRLGPKTPVHPPDPEMREENPAYEEMVRVLDLLREADSGREYPAGLIRRLEAVSLPLLYELEMVALDAGEEVVLRCALLGVLSRYREEAMRQFFSRLFADPREDPLIRETALDLLSTYMEDPVYREATVRVLLSSLEFETDDDFLERIRKILRAGDE